MNKELQTLVWSILPKEFKEEVKSQYADLTAAYKALLSKDSLSNVECDRCNAIREKIVIFNKYFGLHNLTSDMEGEEMLTVEANLVKELYQRAKEIEEESKRIYSPLVAAKYCGVQRAIEDLFGSKCLPDELNEDNFATKEPKPAEATCTDTCTDDCPSQHKIPCVNLSQETANCDKCNGLRLHIAAMAMQGILGNADRMKSYEQIAMSEPYEDLPAVVARKAVRYANALIAESEKGGSDGNS